LEAGETGGILDIILQRLAIYVEKAVKLRVGRQVGVDLPGRRRPPLLCVIVAALLKWVVPIFANLFVGLGVALPLPTRIVIGLSSFVGHFWWFFILGGVGVFFGVKQIRKHPRGRYYFDAMLLKLPIIGNIAAQDWQSPVSPEPGHAHYLRRSYSRRLGHHRPHLRQRRAGKKR